jgi:hypothetical protein
LLFRWTTHLLELLNFSDSAILFKMIKEIQGEGIDWIEGIDVQKHGGEDGEEKIKVKVKPKEE